MSSPEQSLIRPYAGALFAVIVWGASFIATKLGLREVGPLTVIWLRFGIGLVVLGIAVPLRREFFVPSLHDLRFFVFLGAVGITIHQWLQASGLVTALASTTAWIVAAIPLVIALVSRLVLDEPLHRKHIVGIVVGAIGVLLVVSRGDWHLLAEGVFGTPGDFLVAISTITWALFSVYSRKGLYRHKAAPMMFYVMASGWLFSTIPWVLAGGPAEISHLSIQGWGAILFLGVLCSGLAYIYWYDALKALPVAQVGSMLYVEPLITMLVAASILGEPVTLAALIGGSVILLGVRIATLR
ncbi:MAG: DMT family transporter, partial [Bacteroidetes bacterium]|nr:DMT family transporter [Bacteroidota bacterium]